MIVCICRRLNEAAVRAAIDAGARSPECVQAHHGDNFNCGKCREAISEIITSEAECTSQSDLIAAE